MGLDFMMNVGPESFKGSIFLIIAILLGIVTVAMTYINSRKLHGEVFEIPFVYFAIGIFMIVFSLLDVTFLGYFWDESMVILVHDLSFIVGLSFMLAASIKITHYLEEMERFARKLKK